MYNGGEAADQMISYSFKGGEVLLRLTGDGAKHLAIYLANLLKQGGPSKGTKSWASARTHLCAWIDRRIEPGTCGGMPFVLVSME